MTERWANEHAAAARIAASTGRVLLDLRASAGAAADLRAMADRAAQDHIARELTREFPHDPVLSEEAADRPARSAAARVWIIDPLDGTWEYGLGRPDWGVHVAFWQGGDLRAGAVALPALGELYATGPSDAAGPQAGGCSSGRLRMVVSRSRAHPVVLAAAETLGAEVVRLGSAGAKAMAVVAGRAELYAHAGGQHEWDSAAPVAVARAAGLHASRLDGTPLRYNRPDPWLPDLLLCRPELAEAAVAAVHAATG